MMVARSGVGKSASKYAMYEILDHIVYKWMPEPPQPGQVYGRASGIRMLSNPGSAEVLLDELGKEEAEGVSYRLRDVMGFLDVDELASFMGKSSLSGSTLMERFMELDNDGRLDFKLDANSRSGGKTEAINPNLVFSTGVQPAAINALLGRHNVGNGFLARFEVVTGNYINDPDPFTNGAKDMDHCKELYTDLAAYYMRKVDPQGKGVRQLFVIDVHESAKDHMRKAFYKVEKWKLEDDAKNRFDLKLFKLSTLFAVNRKADFVMHEDIDCALWIMEFLNRAADFVSGKLVSTVGNEIDDAVLKIGATLTEKDGKFQLGTLRNRVKPPRRGWDSKKYDERVEYLIESGAIIEIPQAKRGSDGRTKPSYAVPKALAQYNRSIKVAQQPKEAK